MKHAVRISLCASAMMAPWLLTTDAWGAQAETGPASMVDELVVTAQKRSETVQDIPAAITAVSGAVLQQRGVSQPEGLQFIVPSMQAGRLLGQTAITIRGSVAKIVKLEHAWRRLDGRNDDGFQVAPFPG